MLSSLADFILSFPVGIGAMIVIIVVIFQRIRDRKLYGKEEAENIDVLGKAGQVMGNSVYRGMPTDISGMPPSDHFHEPDFSVDMEEEEAKEKYDPSWIQQRRPT